MNFPPFRIISLILLCSAAAFTQPKSPLFYHIFTNHGITSDKTTVVYQDYQGYIWIGTEEGLNKFISYSNLSFDTYKSDREDSCSLIDDYVTTIYEDSQNRLWIGTGAGLCLYNRRLNNFEQVWKDEPNLKNKTVNTIVELNGRLWIGTDDELIVYDAQSGEITKSFFWEDPQKNRAQINILKASKNHIWVGASDGLYMAEDLALEPVKGFETKQVISLELIPDGSLLVGTNAEGIVQLSQSGKTRQLHTGSKPKIIGNKINDLLLTNDSTVWVATNSGLTFLHLNDWTCHSIQYDFNSFQALSDHEVRKLFKDEVGAIWMTTPLGGVNYYHASDNQFDYIGQQTATGQDNELLDYNVLSLVADQKDSSKLWIGTRAGLSLYSEKENKFRHYPFMINEERLNNQFLSIAQDQDAMLWLGTERGLYTWNRRTKQYRAMDDHPDFSDRINAVYIDKQENIWIGTRDKGLKRISKQQQKEYDIKFGIAEDRVTLPNINDIIQQPDSTIWVGTAKGLYFVDQDELQSRTIHLDSLDVDDVWVNYLCRSVSDQLLIGTRKKGILMLGNDGNDQVYLNMKKGLPSNDIRSMVRVNDSLIWVSTNVGLSKIVTKKDEIVKVLNYYVQDGLQGKQFTPHAGAMLSHRIYFGGLSGITAFAPGEIQQYELPLQVNLTKLVINDQEIKPGDDSALLPKALSVTDTLVLPPNQNNLTISFAAMDYVRPDSIMFRYRMVNYNKEWLTTRNAMTTYTNLPRGKQFTFEVMAKSRFREWSIPRQLTIYVEPYFYETAWFKILSAFLVIAILFGLLRFRELSAAIKQRNLQRLVDIRTKELHLEIEEKRKTAVQLEKAKNDAEKANRVKSEFLANISHEIRTPLNGILGMSHLVSENEPNPENKEMLSILGRSAESLRAIIDDLLDLSKIEAGKFDIVHEEFNLPDLIKYVSQAFYSEVSMKSLSMEVSVDESIPTSLLGDELRIKQVIVNLISNAIKFTESGKIELKAKSMGQSPQQITIQLSIRDTGIGIPEGKTEEIFSSFTQIDSGSKRKYGGTGLGLAICKKLVTLMDGKIWVESTYGEGTLFVVELILSLPTDDSHEDPKDTTSIPNGRKILLVEDNMVNTMVAVKMLQKSNQQVDTAIHGKEALEKLATTYYDLILMDVQMPVMDGLETTLAIRNSQYKSSKTPIVALTAGAMPSDRDRCLEVGMNDFIAKPIHYDQLAKLLIKYLNNPVGEPSMQK